MKDKIELPSVDIKKLTALYEENEFLSKEDLQKAGIKTRKLNDFMIVGKLSRIKHNQYALTDKFYKDFRCRYPDSNDWRLEWRRDLQTIRVAENLPQSKWEPFIRSKMNFYADISGLLIDDIQFQPPVGGVISYEVRYHPVRSIPLKNGYCFLMDHMHSHEHLESQVMLAQQKKQWSLSSYFKQVITDKTNPTIQHNMNATLRVLEERFGASLGELVALTEYHPEASPLPFKYNATLLQHSSGIYLNSEAKTFFLGDIDKKSVHHVGALKTLLPSIVESGKSIASLVFMRTLMVAGVGLSMHHVAHAEDKAHALAQEGYAWLGAGIGALYGGMSSGPWGALAGGMIGGYAGSMLSDTIYMELKEMASFSDASGFGHYIHFISKSLSELNSDSVKEEDVTIEGLQAKKWDEESIRAARHVLDQTMGSTGQPPLDKVDPALAEYMLKSFKKSAEKNTEILKAAPRFALNPQMDPMMLKTPAQWEQQRRQPIDNFICCLGNEDIRSQSARAEYLYVILESGEVVISPREHFIQMNSDHEPLKIFHRDLASGQPVLGAGRLTVQYGRITHIDNDAPDYRPHDGDPSRLDYVPLERIVTTAFIVRGLHEAEHCYFDAHNEIDNPAVYPERAEEEITAHDQEKMRQSGLIKPLAAATLQDMSLILPVETTEKHKKTSKVNSIGDMLRAINPDPSELPEKKHPILPQDVKDVLEPKVVHSSSFEIDSIGEALKAISPGYLEQQEAPFEKMPHIKTESSLDFGWLRTQLATPKIDAHLSMGLSDDFRPPLPPSLSIFSDSRRVLPYDLLPPVMTSTPALNIFGSSTHIQRMVDQAVLKPNHDYDAPDPRSELTGIKADLFSFSGFK